MSNGNSRHGSAASPARLVLRGHWRRLGSVFGLRRLRERFGATVYVDWRELPPEPESPYRARLTLPAERTPPGFELREREVVHGEVRTIYEIHCACGKRWLTPQRESVQLCPRCARAVLLSQADAAD